MSENFIFYGTDMPNSNYIHTTWYYSDEGRPNFFHTFDDEIKNWLKENITYYKIDVSDEITPNLNFYIETEYIEFRNIEDALYFKMRWF